MDVFFNPIFPRDSSNQYRDSTNPNRPSNALIQPEKLTFQPTFPQEKFTFNPLMDPPKGSFKQQNIGLNPSMDNYPHEELILADLSNQSSSLNNSSVISVNQSNVNRSFFKNPLYNDNSASPKPEKYNYYWQQEPINNNQKNVLVNQELHGEKNKFQMGGGVVNAMNPGLLMNKLGNDNTKNLESLNKKGNQFYDIPNVDEKNIFKKTAEFKDLGFSERGTFGANPSKNVNRFPNIQENASNFEFTGNNMSNMSRSYDIDEKSVLLDVSHLKDKVINALSKYKQHLTSDQGDERKKNIENDYQDINKEFSVILDKYATLNVSQMAESGYIGVSNSNMSYLCTGGPNENEINNMMELVQEFLDKFQPRTANDKHLITAGSENNLRKDGSVKSEIPYTGYTVGMPRETKQKTIMNEQPRETKTSFKLNEQYLKQSDALYPNTYQEEIKSIVSPPKKQSNQERMSSKAPLSPLEKIEQIKRQRRNEELEQSFLSIRNNITAFDLDHTRNHELSYFSEVSILSPQDKPFFAASGANNRGIITKKKTSKANLFGFYPKITRFYRNPEEFEPRKLENMEIELACERCDNFFKVFMLPKHRSSCYGGKSIWDAPKPREYKYNDQKIIQLLKYLVQKISKNAGQASQELEARLLNDIKICLSRELRSNLPTILRDLVDLTEHLSKKLSFANLIGYLIIAKRLERLIEGDFPEDKMNKSLIFFEEINSDDEEQTTNKISPGKPKLIKQEIKGGDSFKKKKEDPNNNNMSINGNSEAEIKNYFFTEAVNAKFRLPNDHPMRKVLISDLYEEAIGKGVAIEDFRWFIEDKLQINPIRSYK